MRSKIYWLALLLILFSFLALQFTQAVLQDSETITNYAAITSITTGVFWEFGVESGVLKPPFEIAGPVGDGSRVDSYVQASTEQAVSGIYSIKHYMRPPTQSDAQRRLSAREYSVFSEVSPSPIEYYFSFWRYFPDNVADADGSEGLTTNQWTNLGGIGIRYGPSSDKTRYRDGVILVLNDPNSNKDVNHDPAVHPPRRFIVKRYHLYSRSTGQDHTEYNTNWYLDSSMTNKWLHFQIYLKFSNGSDGGWKVWISDGTTETKVLDWSGATDPRSDLSRWNTEGCEFYYKPYGHYAKISLYQPTPSPERWTYTDDAVLSYTKVPDSYRVGG